LERQGHDALLVGPGVTGPEGALLLGRTTTVPANRAATPIAISTRMRRRLQEHVGAVDVVHVHEPLMPVVGPAAMRLDGPATVATFHADPPRWARRAYRSMAPLARSLLKGVDVVTAVSPVAASAVEEVVDECRVIPNGIDVAEYGAGRGDPRRVVFLGRDDRRKGLSVLLEAWRRVIETEAGATLTVVGAARSIAVPGVRFLGPVSEERKRAELTAAGVLAAPNLGGESFGLVLLEGMASGCAIVASSIPAFRHVLGETGVFVGPGDPIALAEALLRLMRAPDAATSLAEAARRRAERFDGAVVAAEYVRAYTDAIDRRRR